MQNYKLRIRIYDPINGFIIPGMGGYREEEFKCDVEQFFKSEDENEIIFSVTMPYNYVVRLKDTFREQHKNDCKNDRKNDCIVYKDAYILEHEEDEEDEEEPNTTDEFDNQLDILSDEVNEFLSQINDASELLADDLEEIETDKEQLEKVRKLRADLEKIKLEFGELL